ncbi:hypothetical protein [Bradyrhizobium sp. S3.5.5]|uniref:transcription termination/antitermination protein NusG n=1 Tax=Bradyrhizobium sp. S3.5.5 TaxID=3156430 RepID=UPI00339B97EA
MPFAGRAGQCGAAARRIVGWRDSFVSRGTRALARRPHLGRRVEKPFLPGLIFLPEFEVRRFNEIRSIPDVDSLVDFGKLRSWLYPSEMQFVREIVVVENLLPSRRKAALLQRFVRYGFVEAEVAEEEVNLKVGREIRVADGLFSGFVALIERIDSSGRLSLYVRDGKRGVKVTGLTETQIELID